MKKRTSQGAKGRVLLGAGLCIRGARVPRPTLVAAFAYVVHNDQEHGSDADGVNRDAYEFVDGNADADGGHGDGLR